MNNVFTPLPFSKSDQEANLLHQREDDFSLFERRLTIIIINIIHNLDNFIPEK